MRLRWAHPRSRGENCRLPDARKRVEGSSPLTRGKPSWTTRSTSPRGLIPAHAGKTYDVAAAARVIEAHPRSRGENWWGYSGEGSEAGSSPLTRGKPRPRRRRRSRQRLIPAHAGKTSQQQPRGKCDRAHPRSRGENIQTTVQTVAGWGSSPLTRGKRGHARPHLVRDGLIPAHAGKTRTRSEPGRRSRAHPRSRGENAFYGASCDDDRGSSPLTRGKRGPVPTVIAARGLIPAHAGKTRPGTDCHSRARAHPRSRGENSATGSGAGCARGSSPLTRGKRAPRASRPVETRLIPAHAGKTFDGGG